MAGLAERVFGEVEQIPWDILREMWDEACRVVGCMLSSAGAKNFGEADSCHPKIPDRPDREQVQNHVVV